LSDSLQVRFEKFLRGVKTSESLDDELRERLSVETPLSIAVVGALEGGRDVVIAGSAGGGKTHLIDDSLRRVAGQLKLPVREIVDARSLADAQTASEPHLRVVRDLTAVDQAVRGQVLDGGPAVHATVVAANEGPLLALAREAPESRLARTREMLHRAQQADVVPCDATLPALVDLGGYDPAADKAVEKLLDLKILRDLVTSQVCDCQDASVCPRKLAWSHLSDPEVRKRVAHVLTLAASGPEPFLFRDLWDLLSDLALGGTCDEDGVDDDGEKLPPSSPWFWRLFRGPTRLAAAITEVFQPEEVVVPGLDDALYFGDWGRAANELRDGASLVELVGGDAPYRGELWAWLKCQALFLSQRDPLARRIRKLAATETVTDLVGDINRYMTYGLLPDDGTRLTCWLDLGIERRQDRPRGAFSVGVAEASKLRIESSRVFVNLEGAPHMNGRRLILRHDDSGAWMELLPEMRAALASPRSFRVSDRDHTDAEWDLRTFFIKVVQGLGLSSGELDIACFDFAGLTATRRSYVVQRAAGLVTRRVVI
jgi:hypothetical protein